MYIFEVMTSLDKKSGGPSKSVCYICCYTSFHEGFGLPIIEANAVGRVVITSNIGAMKEICGNSAYFINPYNNLSIRNGILDIITNPILRNNLIRNGF